LAGLWQWRWGAARWPVTRSSGARRPNIVFILADNMGWGDMGAYNRYSVITASNLNRLASQGMRFVDMHFSSGLCTNATVFYIGETG
jgi:arylsulfatase A-like enzyme